MVQFLPILAVCAISHWNRHRWKWASALPFWKQSLRTMDTCWHSVGSKYFGNICGKTIFLFTTLNKFCQNYNKKVIFYHGKLNSLRQLASQQTRRFILIAAICLIGVMTIADVMTGDGSKVTKHALDVSHLLRASSKWDWPSKCPCNWDILCWCKGICLITSEKSSLPFLLHLERWIHPSHLNWQWFYQHWDHSLYHLVNNVCHVFWPYDMTRVIFYLKGQWLMLILQNWSMSLYMISLTNWKIAGHWPTDSFRQTLLWLYRQLFMEWLSWWAMVLINPFSWPK